MYFLQAFDFMPLGSWLSSVCETAVSLSDLELEVHSRQWRRVEGGDTGEQRQQDHSTGCVHPKSGQGCKSALTASHLDDVGSAGEAGTLHHGAKHTAVQDSETLKEGLGGGAAVVGQAHQGVEPGR